MIFNLVSTTEGIYWKIQKVIKVKATYNNKEDIIWDLVVMAVVVVMAAVKRDKLVERIFINHCTFIVLIIVGISYIGLSF